MKTPSITAARSLAALLGFRLFLFAGLTFPAVGIRAEISLKGIVVTESVAKFSLYSSEDQASKWVSVGQDFAGYHVEAFDVFDETLTLTAGQHRFALRIAALKKIDSQAADNFSIKKTRYVFAGGRFEALFGTGMDVAYELVEKGDTRLGNLLVEYETALASYNELASLAPAASEHLAILAQRAANVRAMVERAVTEKTQSGSSPHPPIH